MKALPLLTVLIALCSSRLLSAAPLSDESGYWPDDAQLVISISMQFEATAQDSSDEDESNKSTVKSTCHPVKTQSELERDIRTSG